MRSGPEARLPSAAMPVALGPETEGRLRAYFGALLRADEVDRAVNSVQLRTVPSASVVEAFVAAHTVLGLYLRVSVDVEADVLVRDVGLTTEQAARVVGLTEAEVRAAVAEAEAFVAEGGSTSVDERVADAATPDAIDVADTAAPPSDVDVAEVDAVAPDAATDQSVETTAPDDADAAVEAAAHALRAERHLAPDAPDAASATEPDVEPVRPWATVDGNGHGVRSVVVIEADEEEDVGEAPILVPRGRGRLYTLAALVLVLSFAVGVVGWFTWQDAVTPPVNVTDVVMKTAIDIAGEPEETRETFTVGEPILLWVRYEPPDRPVTVGIQYFRSDEPLLPNPSEFDLPMNGKMTLPVSAQIVDEPGRYRIEITSDGDTIAEAAFEVEGA